MYLHGRNILDEFHRDAPLIKELIVFMVVVGGWGMMAEVGLLWEKKSLKFPELHTEK